MAMKTLKKRKGGKVQGKHNELNVKVGEQSYLKAP